MASIKKKSSGGGGGANWMDTYGDMVTLLLCFFVLLYSMSTIDTKKWEWIVQQFNKDYNPTQAVEPGPEPDPANSGGGAGLPTTQVDEAMQELYDFLAAFAQQQDSSVSVSKGDGYVFISFDDTVFFDGDSSTIRPEGEALLDGIIPALERAGQYVDELRVMGHTAQRQANAPNRVDTDRRLASGRATEVVIYLQERLDSISPGRLIPMGYGQWRPVSGNETSESRSKNRRVELVITGKDLENILEDNFEQYYTMYETSTGQTVERPD